MTPKMIWANLAVSNLERTTKFYTALGFKANGTPNKDLTSFLFGEGNFIIHFFLKDVLQAFLKSEMPDSQQANEVIYTLSAETKEQVDSWAKEVEKLFPNRKYLEKGIMVLFLPTPMGISSMCFICRCVNRINNAG